MMSRQSPHKSQQQPAQPSSGKITVDDLLKFKRAERPSAEFWTTFDAQLKQRQLAAAIQEKRPWWHALPHYALALPAGAAAALAIGFIVWRNALPQTPVAQTATTSEAETTAPGTTVFSGIVSSGINAPSNTPAPIATAVEKNTAAEFAATQPVSEAHLDAARDAFVASSAAANSATLPERARAPGTKSIGSFALLGAKPTSAQNTSTTTLLTMPVSLANDLPPLALITASAPESSDGSGNTHPAKTEEPADPRRERLMAYYTDALPAATAATTANDNPRISRVRDRITSRFNDKTLTDSISRFGATGDTVTIKF